MLPQQSVLRTSQLDATELDKELNENIELQIKETFNLTSQHEVTLLVESLIIGSQIIQRGSTYGLRLQNLIYRDRNGFKLSASQRYIYVIIRVLFKYIFAKLDQYMTMEEWGSEAENSIKYKLWRLWQRLGLLYKLLSTINFILFLRNGKYLNLIDRMLGFRLYFEEKEMSRMMSFEFMNRQLVWAAFSEFFIQMSPLFSISWLKNYYRTFSGNDTMDSSVCMFCFNDHRDLTDIQLPYVTNCGHVYCYYCVKSNMMADSSLGCPRCGTLIEDIEPFVKMQLDGGPQTFNENDL